MKTIFKKSHLPFLKPTLKNGSGRDLWRVTRCMQDEDGLQHQLSAEIMLLQKGVQKNDPWSMCELARTYFNHCGDNFLPIALSLWKQAALLNDDGAKYDLDNLPILQRILSYLSFDGNEYKEIEMKCALLTEMYLHKPWKGSWNSLSDYEIERRCKELVKMVTKIIQIPEIDFNIVPNLSFEGRIVDGLAGWDNKVSIRKEICIDIERVIEVIFHELAHIVTFEIQRKTPHGAMLQRIYGVSDQRVESWRNGSMGYEVVTSEEDPDTLSYGVYTLWATFFY